MQGRPLTTIITYRAPRHNVIVGPSFSPRSPMSFIIIQSVILPPNREQANSLLGSNPSQPHLTILSSNSTGPGPFPQKTLLRAASADPFSVSVSPPSAEAPQTSLAASPPPAPRGRHPSLLPPRISGGAASLVTVPGAHRSLGERLSPPLILL